MIDAQDASRESLEQQDDVVAPCCRYAPHPEARLSEDGVQITFEKNFSVCWPVTYMYDWCGDYESAKDR